MTTNLKKTLQNARRKVYRDLRKLFKPHMHASAYRVGRIGQSRPMMLYAPKDKAGHFTTIDFNGFRLMAFMAFAEHGIMVDADGGGCVIESLACFPLEDLLMLKKWAEKNLPSLPTILPSSRPPDLPQVTQRRPPKQPYPPGTDMHRPERHGLFLPGKPELPIRTNIRCHP